MSTTTTQQQQHEDVPPPLQEQQPLHKRKREDDDNGEDHSPEAKRRRVDERELERQRQRQEREERKQSGLAVEKPKLKAAENPEDALKQYKTGGVYIPPFKMRLMQKISQDKKTIEYQRMNWDALKKSVNGLINKVNVSNITNIIPEIFAENLVRGRGLFTRSLMKAQAASPTFTHVYAALLAVINTKMPELGELVLKRLIVAFRKAYQRNDKPRCIACCKFIAHLVNQQVAHEILAGQMLSLLLEKPTDDSVELAVQITKECGQVLNTIAPKIVHAVFERFRSVLHEGQIDKRVQYMIEGLFAIRKTEFKDFPGIVQSLDLVEADDQITHELELEEQINTDNQLDYFHFDEEFEQNEERYAQIKRAILGEQEEQKDSSDSSSSEDESDEDEKSHEVKDVTEAFKQKLSQDELIEVKRNIYLTIMSSLDYQECCHKLVKSGYCEGHEMELCGMIIDCCTQERTYLRFYGQLATRFCQLDKIYQEKFEECFRIQYSLIHRLEMNKLRNLAKLFAHIFYSDGMSWAAFEFIKLTQEDTTSGSRIFLKILFQDISEHIGLAKLTTRLNDQYLKDHFAGLFPTDSAKNVRFAINYWTSIGLGAVTETLRAILKQMPQPAEEQPAKKKQADSSEDESSSSSDSEEERKRRKKRRHSSNENDKSPSRRHSRRRRSYS